MDQDDKSRSSLNSEVSRENNQCLINNLLRAELLGQPVPAVKSESDHDQQRPSPSSSILKYRSDKQRCSDETPSPISSIIQTLNSPKRLSPTLSNKYSRKISRTPYKILDAPSLQDDFYLNLVDWSNNNLLAVGLGTTVYLWSASTSKVCDIHIHLTCILYNTN